MKGKIKLEIKARQKVRFAWAGFALDSGLWGGGVGGRGHSHSEQSLQDGRTWGYGKHTRSVPTVKSPLGR